MFLTIIFIVMRLNPYYTGYWFARGERINYVDLAKGVLILVILDIGLRENLKAFMRNTVKVLILVILDIGLRDY